MCTFVTIGFPEKYKEEVAALIPRGLDIYASSNVSVAKVMPQEYTIKYLTSGGCSCALFYEYDPDAEKNIDIEKTKLWKKYEKKGWSKLKIQRSLSQSFDHRSRKEEDTGYSPEALELICNIVQLCGEMNIFSHWYEGDVDDKKLTLRKIKPIKLSVFKDKHKYLRYDDFVKIYS